MDLEKLLRDALAPCEPGPKPEVAVMARIATLRRKPRQLVVITSVLALAAAAATLSVSLRHSTAPRPLSEVAAVVPPATAASGSLVEVATSAAPATSSDPIPPADANESAASATARDVNPGTIFVLPLQHLAVDERSKAAVELFYSSLLGELSAVPGLTVIVDPLPPEYSRPRSDYRLSVKGGGSLPGDKFQVIVVVGEEKLADAKFSGRYFSALTGDIGNTCVAACKDPVSLAAQAVTQLAERGFLPAAPAPALPTDFERTEQYRLWMASVENGSPLATLLDNAYAGIDSGTWSYATKAMETYDRMMSSPEDLASGRILELDIQQALRELPLELTQGFKIWPAKCRVTMCAIQVADVPPGNSSNASLGLIRKALRDKGLLSEDSKSPFTRQQMTTGKGSSFWFLTRRDGTQAGAE